MLPSPIEIVKAFDQSYLPAQSQLAPEGDDGVHIHPQPAWWQAVGLVFIAVPLHPLDGHPGNAG